MSRIFPAGGGSQFSWLDKVAEGKEEPIGTAAIDLKSLRKLAGFGEENDVETEEVEEEDVKPEDAEEAEEGEKPPFGNSEEVSDEEEGETEEHEEDESAEFEAGEEEEAGEESSAVNEAAAAVEKAKSALEEVSVALEDAGADAGDEMAEIPVSVEDDVVVPEDDAMIEVEISDSFDQGEEVDFENIGEEPVGEVDVTEKFNPGSNAPEAAGSLMAGSSSRFHKIASLSPANKKKLKDYWVGQLGYDPEFVGMMLKDYNPKSGKKS